MVLNLSATCPPNLIGAIHTVILTGGALRAISLRMAATLARTIPLERRMEIVQHVLLEVSSGRSVADIFRRDEGMPEIKTFWVWHWNDQQLQHELACARERGVEALLDEIPDIADGRDLERNDDGTLKNPQDAFLMDTQRAKLRVNAREKRAQMIAPRKYGTQNIDIRSAGEKLGSPAVPKDDADQIIDLIKTIEHQHILSPKAQDLLS